MYDHHSDRWETESESSWFIDSTASARLISISSNQDIFQFNTTIQSSSSVSAFRETQMLSKPATSSLVSASIIRAAFLKEFILMPCCYTQSCHGYFGHANFWHQHTDAKQIHIKRTLNTRASTIMIFADDEYLPLARWTPVASRYGPNREVESAVQADCLQISCIQNAEDETWL